VTIYFFLFFKNFLKYLGGSFLCHQYIVTDGDKKRARK
jgi:hypothetical protein